MTACGELNVESKLLPYAAALSRAATASRPRALQPPPLCCRTCSRVLPWKAFIAAVLLPHSKTLVNLVDFKHPLYPTPGQYGETQSPRCSGADQKVLGQPNLSLGGQSQVMLMVQVEVQPCRSITVRVKSPRVF